MVDFLSNDHSDLTTGRMTDYRYETREAWLQALAEPIVTRLCKASGLRACPSVRIAFGFPSSGRGSNTIGECWCPAASADRTTEIWIAPQFGLGDERRVADILAHEMAHALLGVEAGHGKVFAALVRSIGLEGDPTATIGGPAFWDWIDPILRWQVGPLPHGAHLLRALGRSDTPRGRCPGPKYHHTPQTTRMIKCACDVCGYTARTSRKWLEAAGAPICPTDNVPMTAPLD